MRAGFLRLVLLSKNCSNHFEFLRINKNSNTIKIS